MTPVPAPPNAPPEPPAPQLPLEPPPPPQVPPAPPAPTAQQPASGPGSTGPPGSARHPGARKKDRSHSPTARTLITATPQRAAGRFIGPRDLDTRRGQRETSVRPSKYLSRASAKGERRKAKGE